MGIIAILKKFKNNFVDNIKYISERLSYGMKKAEEKRSNISSGDDFQNFSKGIQNLNKNLLGDSDSSFTNYTPNRFNEALTGRETRLKQFDNDIPHIKVPKSGLEKHVYPKRVKYIIEEEEPEIVYIKKRRRKSPKTETIYVDDEIPKGFTSSFENLSGVPDNIEEYDLFETDEKKQNKKKRDYDFIHGSR